MPSSNSALGINGWRVIYLDKDEPYYYSSTSNWNIIQQNIVDAGYNCLILGFYSPDSKPDPNNNNAPENDAIEYWMYPQGPTNWATKKRSDLKVLMSVGGGSWNVYMYNPEDLGKTIGEMAANNMFDGIDFDTENFLSGSANWDGKWNVSSSGAITGYIDWLVRITIATYNAYYCMKGSKPIITHAPQGPYFGNWASPSLGFVEVEKQAGAYIDWYNIQFYNQGVDCYVTPDGLTTKSCSNFPGTSIGEIISMGIPASKIVVGKPIASIDASNGQVSNLSSLLNGAQYGGIMGWQYSTTNDFTCGKLFNAPCPNFTQFPPIQAAVIPKSCSGHITKSTPNTTSKSLPNTTSHVPTNTIPQITSHIPTNKIPSSHKSRSKWFYILLTTDIILLIGIIILLFI